MQLETFEKEISFMQDPKVKVVFDLGQNLNLSLDLKGYLKADGRIASI